MSPLSKSLLITTLTMLVACPSRGESPPHVPAYGHTDHPVSLSLVDDSGVTLPVYGHRGQQWVPGQPGRGYRIGMADDGNFDHILDGILERAPALCRADA